MVVFVYEFIWFRRHHSDVLSTGGVVDGDVADDGMHECMGDIAAA